MLGRTADHLYWLARYMERAENMARLIDVSHRMSLLPHANGSQLTTWSSALEVAGDPEEYAERYGDVSSSDVLRYLGGDPDHASSIYACVRAARENARALRTSITSEMWQCINATWLELESLNQDRLAVGAAPGFFDWIKDRALLFRGITQGTMLQDDSFHFIELGWSVERADNTARLLDAKYHVLLPGGEHVGGVVDYYQWGALLRSLSAFRAYHKIYSDVVTPIRVAELLLLRPDMPRSLLACLERITQDLNALCDSGPRECQRLAGEMHARLKFGRMKTIFASGVHEFLTEFIERNGDLGAQIQRDFMMTK